MKHTPNTGSQSRTFVVAELSANHGNHLDVALATVRAAKEAGADAIKLQTYTADTITLNCTNEDFVVKGTSLWDNRTLYDLYQEAHTPWEWHKAIFDEAESLGLCCFSTPFDNTAVDFLETLGNPIYKIASFEITDLPLIEYTASKGKPMIISTGIALEADIRLAIEACHRAGNHDITLLKCTSAYPARIEEANLMTMVDMKERFGVKVGLSDHTMGTDVVTAAIALGASVIEKHVILDRSLGGPDAAFSMEIDAFAAMVTSIRNIEKALGTVHYETDKSQIKGRQFARSLYVAEDMKAGDVLTEKNLRSVRPGYGLHPKYLTECLGKTVNQDLKKGTRFSLNFLTI